MILLYRKYSGLQKKLSGCVLTIARFFSTTLLRSTCNAFGVVSPSFVFCMQRHSKKKTRNTLSVFCCECLLFSVLFCALFTYNLTKLFFCRVRFFLKTLNMFLSKPVHRVFIVYVLARLKQVWVGGGFNCFPPV